MAVNNKTILRYNSEIKEILTRYKIPVQDGISCLMCLYYSLEPSFIPDVLYNKVFATGIVTKDYITLELEWKKSLFEETENGFEWIVDWMDLFKNVNPERRGIKIDVLKRMKKFFMNNPSVRKDDVFYATNLYISTIKDPTYCKKSHKFIYEMDGSSMLEDYVSKIPVIKKDIFNRFDDVI